MKFKHHVLLHTSFWLLFLGLPVVSALQSEKGMPGLIEYLIVISFINVLNFYSCYFFISSIILKKNKPFSWLWILLPFLVFFTWARMLTDYGIEMWIGGWASPAMPWYVVGIKHFINTLIFTVISVLISFFVGWVKTQQQKNELIRQTQQAELALLRSQINPHFLFNTLNNLYSLVYRKSDEAPGALMKLSEILRYMLYDANEEKVLLEKEVTYIKSYIELQQLRLSKPDFIKLTIEGDPGNRTIPPMLLITFIENAFKHGNKSVESPGIVIHLQNSTDEFIFEVSSYLVEGSAQNKDPYSGIGLQNVRRRLELSYPGKHDLLIGLSNEKFYVKLTIDGI
jgi:hypothetical protein